MRRRSTGTVRVYEVLHDGKGDGPAGDGTFIRRFRTQLDADEFARTATAYGQPAKVTSVDAPRHVAQRWGMA
jgi:hypothetical protein